MYSLRHLSAVLPHPSGVGRRVLYSPRQALSGGAIPAQRFFADRRLCGYAEQVRDVQKACMANCPSGVNTYQIFLEMREEIVKERGLSFTKQSIFRALHWRQFFDFGLSCGAWFQRLIFKPAPDGHGQVARVPLPMAGFNQRRIIPKLPKKHLKSMVPLDGKG